MTLRTASQSDASVSHRRLVATLVGVAGAGGLAAALLDWRLLVPIGLGLPLTAAAVLSDPAAGFLRPGPTEGPARRASAPRATTRGKTAATAPFLHRETFLAGVWTALFFVTTMKLLEGTRPVEAAATGQLSSDNLLELAVTLVAALVVITAIRASWPLRIPPAAWLLVAYALLAVASVTWSSLPLLSAVRAFQLVVLAAFVCYCAGRASLEPGFADRLFVHILRYLAFTAVVLAAFGVLQGALDWERFSWRGTHPNAAAALMLVPTMGVVFHPQRSVILRPFPWWLLPVGLLPLVYATGSRANVAGAAIAVFCGWFVAAMRDRQLGALGIGAGLVVLGTGWGVASEHLSAWLLRGQSAETVTGLNGRVELWEWVLDNPLGSELWGVGIGAARGVLPVSWNPTNVHSSWIDILQTLGVVGLTVMGALVLTLVLLTILRRSIHASWVVAFAALGSLNSVTISLPNYGLVLVCLSIILLADAGTPRRTAEPGADDELPAEGSRDLSLADAST